MAKVTFMPVDILYQRAKYILQNEGQWAFLKQGFSFARNLFFYRANYYIYEKDIDSIDKEMKIKPKEGYTLKVISNPHELDKLIAQGYDFKAMNFRSKLKKAAIAFCLFAGQELASVTWVASNKEAKREIDYLPFRVNFEAGSVCSGDSYTPPAYRGKGLLAHTYSYIFCHYLANDGVLKDKFSIEVKNIASQKAHAKFNPVITSKGRYLKIFWWESWKEQPIKEGSMDT